MQTRLRVTNIQGVGPMPQSSQSGQQQRPQYRALLLTLVPVEPPADGTPTGDIHLAGPVPVLHLMAAGDANVDFPVGSEILLSIQKA